MFANMKRVRDAVRAVNFKGVLIQSWEDYKKAKL